MTSQARQGSAQPAVFRDAEGVHRSDLCEPLKRARARGDVRLQALARPPYPGTVLAGNALPGLCSVGFWDARGRQRWGLDWHRNEGIEITCVRSGKCPFAVENHQTMLDHRQFAVTQPWERHRLGDPHIRPSRLAWIILDVGVHRPNQRWRWPDWLLLSAEERRRVEQTLRESRQCVWQISPEVRTAFDRLLVKLEAMAEHRIAFERWALLISDVFASLADLTATGSKRSATQRTDSARTVELFMRELPRHIDHPWTVAKMAEACGLGVSQFTAICKRLWNLTPNDLLAQARVKEAGRLLTENPAASVTHIALRCGFSSSQYLAYSFRRWYGITPSQFRARETA